MLVRLANAIEVLIELLVVPVLPLQRVQREVVSDPVEPRLQAHGSIVAHERSVGSRKGVLHHVLGVIRSHDATAIADERSPVTPNDGFVSARGARSHELDEPPVVLKPGGGA